MRIGIWMLAACGLVGLAFGAGLADEQPSGQRFAFDEPAPRNLQYFSRGARPAEPAEPRRDEALPGTLPTTRPGQPPARYVRNPQSQPRPAAAGSGANPLPGVKNYHQDLFGTERPVIQAGGTVRDEGELIHAEYNRPEGASAEGQIRQVGVHEIDVDEEAFPFARPQRRPAPGSEDDEPNPFATQRLPSRAPQPAQAPVPPPNDTFIGGSVSVPPAPDGPQTAMVQVQWAKRGTVAVGQPCDCDLIVKNTGQTPARDVVVDAYFPRTVRLTNAEPAPAEKTDRLSWQFPALEAGEEQTIRISLVPSRRGELAVTAHVRFTGAAGGVFQVEEPLLEVKVKGPDEVHVGDPAPQLISVSNPGTGIARNVVLEARIPKGLEHPRGERLVMDIGALNPGETRLVRLALAAVEGGRYQIPIEAKADAGLRQDLTAELVVMAPSISVEIDGPGLRYIGRSAVYDITVTNDGTAASNNVRVVHRTPEGFKFQQADKGGTHDGAGRTTHWFVGRIEPGQSIPLKLELTPVNPGSYVHQVAAVSEQGAKSEAQVETQVEGSASLVLEIVDLNDPVEVGVETAYEVRVRNAGTKAATNVGVACEMSPHVELLTAKGPTEHTVEDGVIVFQSLKELEPGKAALYRVHVRGKLEGNHRFRARLTSDSMQEPLIFEESTKFYVD